MCCAEMGKTTTTLEAGRSALERHAWAEALALLKQADLANELDADGLEMLADAAWWMAQPADSLAARERAYAAFVAAGNKRRATRVALRLTQQNASKRAMAVAQAWYARAEKLVEGDEDSAEFGGVLFVRFLMHAGPSNLDEQVALGRRIAVLGERFGDRDLQAFGAMAEGFALLESGDVKAGFAQFDVATLAAAAGELTTWSTGWVYCATIGACRELADYQRASAWTDATTRWCERQSVTGFPGICRVHRAEVVALRGAWAQAEQEARRACEELQRWEIGEVAALGFYQIGEIRLRMGDTPAAEQAFRKAHEMGMVPEPGMSLVRLAEGDAASAGSSLRRALANEGERFARARLLPADVEVALILGDRERARAASKELDGIAKSFGTPAMEAIAGSARAALQLADGDADAADATLRSAMRLWLELDVPYEVARTRVLLAAAYRAQGDGAAATLELQAARSTFERLGARRDERHAGELLGDGAIVPTVELPLDTVERTFLFTDIVRSTKLVDALGDAAWQELIRWHDQNLRSLIAEHRGEEIRHQGDGFFVAFASATDAIECAVAIQRRLAEQRRKQGFALQIRIGMHTAIAHRRGLDYAGFGVHEAARIGGVAEGGEIIVSAATLDAAKTAYPSEKRSVMLKDIAEPVEVRSIDWR
jgi:class 3 adenylate cyclase